MNEVITELVSEADTDPLDLLNKWWAGVIDDQTMHTLMQRALLHQRESTIVVADPRAFQKQRSLLVRDDIDNFLCSLIEDFRVSLGKFAVSDGSYAALKNHLRTAMDDHLRLSKKLRQNIVNGNYDEYKAYSGMKEFFDVVDYLVQGNVE